MESSGGRFGKKQTLSQLTLDFVAEALTILGLHVMRNCGITVTFFQIEFRVVPTRLRSHPIYPPTSSNNGLYVPLARRSPRRRRSLAMLTRSI